MSFGCEQDCFFGKFVGKKNDEKVSRGVDVGVEVREEWHCRCWMLIL